VSNLDVLKAVTTRQLLMEVSVRMRTTQNGTAGLDLAGMCDEGVEQLDSGILDYSVVKAEPGQEWT